MLLKIFSYNIHGLPFIPDFYSENLAAWFHKSDYDIIALQEVFSNGRKEILTKSLEENGYIVFKPNNLLQKENLLDSGLLTAFKKSIFEHISDGFTLFNKMRNCE